VGISLSDSSIYTGGGASDVAVGRVLSRAWTVFTNNFVVFFVTTLVISLPNLLIESASKASATANPRAITIPRAFEFISSSVYLRLSVPAGRTHGKSLMLVTQSRMQARTLLGQMQYSPFSSSTARSSLD